MRNRAGPKSSPCKAAVGTACLQLDHRPLSSWTLPGACARLCRSFHGGALFSAERARCGDDLCHVVGGVAGHYLGRPISKGDLEELGEALTPDSSAYLLLLEEVNREDVIDSMAGYNANVVTLTVGSELSGEIASYTKGVVADP